VVVLRREKSPMNHIGISSLLTSLTTGTLGFFVYFRNRQLRLYYLFFLYSLSIALWSLFVTFQVVTNVKSIAYLSATLLNVAATFIPVFFLHFLKEFFNDPPDSWSKRILPWVNGVALVLSFLGISGFLVGDVVPRHGLTFLMVPNPSYVCLIVFFIACVACGLIRLVIGFRNATGIRRNQIKYLLFGSIIGYTGGLNNFLIIYDIDIFPLNPFGNYAIALYVMATAYAIAQYRLLDINVIFRQSLIYASLLLMLLIPCYVLVIWGQKTTFGSFNYTFSAFILVLFIVVGFLFPKVRFRTEEALERVLFKKRVDYRDTLLRSSRDMVSIVDIKALSENLVRTVGRSLAIEKVSLLLSNEAGGSYHLEASVGLDLEETDRVLLAKEGPLVKLLQRRSEPIVREELEWIPMGPETFQTIQTMATLGAEISLPIVSKGKLIGILNLGHKDDKTLYSNEDLELLSTLANQAAIALENARLYENLKQSQDTLRRADRLSSLGLLTAGLAHEIRNPLVAIRTFTQLLPERYEDAEFREGFQGLALKEVDRICGLINDLLSFARPSKPNVVPENVNDVVDNIARILETQAKEKNVIISRDFGDNLPKVWIDREQMKQVFMNLILNAIQAMKEGGSINIATRSVSRNGTQPSGDFVQIEVRDTGVGIPEENLQHIFDPFFTSKDEGSGLGLAVSHQIVQEHGGFVTVESHVGKGTAFFVHVPVSKPVRPVANGRAHANEANLSH
jgi:two-component system NtrC family sensor kinase